jgi:hypothetical protein
VIVWLAHDLILARPQGEDEMVAKIGDPEERQRLRIARAYAIEQYASMEHALCTLFAKLLSAPVEKAALAFFKITNARARNTIISDLLENEFHSQYDLYWHGSSEENKNEYSRSIQVNRQIRWPKKTSLYIGQQ